MRTNRWAPLAWAVVSALLVVSAARTGWAQAQAQPTPPPAAAEPAAPAPGYVGMDTCAGCHEPVVNAFKATPHMASSQGCEGCHGPGQAHAENAGDKTKIRVFKGLSSVESSSTCMSCHNKDNQKHWVGSSHDSRQVACTQCHNPHPAEGVHEKALLRQPQMKLCTSCHLQKKAQLIRPGHMPLREGKMECTACHNPHGSTSVRMLKVGNSVNETCVSCHTEKRGPHLWDHAPVREACNTCHDPHGSNHERMLVAKPPMLCQRCHIGTRHPSTIYDGNQLAARCMRRQAWWV